MEYVLYVLYVCMYYVCMYMWSKIYEVRSTMYLLRVLDYEHDVVLEYVLYLGACIICSVFELGREAGLNLIAIVLCRDFHPS